MAVNNPESRPRKEDMFAGKSPKLWYDSEAVLDKGHSGNDLLIGEQEEDTVDGITCDDNLCVKPTADEEDITDYPDATTELCITNPDAQGAHRNVSIGATVTSLSDEHCHIRHFISGIITGSPASNMAMRIEDEIMLLNERPLVDVGAKDLEDIFAQVKIGQEFSLLTNRRNVLDFNKPHEVDYEYWRITATITVDKNQDPVLAERATVIRTQNGDVIVITEANVTPVYVRVDSGYVKNTGGLLAVHSVLQADDEGYNFEMLSYDAYTVENAGLDKQKIRLFQHFSSENRKSFLHVNTNGNVELTAPDAFPVPSKKEINEGKEINKFAIHKAMFLSMPALKAAEMYYLKSYTRKDSYLAYDQRQEMFVLEAVPKDYMLDYKDDIKIEVIPST